MVFTAEWEVGSGIKENFDVYPVADRESIGLQTKRSALSVVWSARCAMTLLDNRIIDRELDFELVTLFVSMRYFVEGFVIGALISYALAAVVW